MKPGYLLLFLFILVFIALAPPNIKPKEEKTDVVWKSEATACQLLSQLCNNKPFEKVRPDFLTNPATGKRLELDCYNEELKLALEYNGSQHYHYPNRFHKTEEDFVRQVQRDILKEELVRAQGIDLIVVPYTIRPNQMHPYIKDQLKRLGR